jgi:hypothetical protein
MQCHVGVYFLSNSFLMNAAMSCGAWRGRRHGSGHVNSISVDPRDDARTRRVQSSSRRSHVRRQLALLRQVSRRADVDKQAAQPQSCYTFRRAAARFCVQLAQAVNAHMHQATAAHTRGAATLRDRCACVTLTRA